MQYRPRHSRRPSKATEAICGLPKDPSVQFSLTSPGCFSRRRTQRQRSLPSSIAAFAMSSSACPAGKAGLAKPSLFSSAKFCAGIKCATSKLSCASEHRYPKRESASRARSIAGHGLIGEGSVSSSRSAVWLTNADPDAVKGASELQRSHCPALFEPQPWVHGPWPRAALRTSAASISVMMCGTPQATGVTAGETAQNSPRSAFETRGGTGDDCSVGKRGVWPRHYGQACALRSNVGPETDVTAGETAPQFGSFVGNEDGAEPSVTRSSDAGAVPAASTKELFAFSAKNFLAGANQDRRRSEDRSCARHDSAVSGSPKNCEQRQRSRRSSPRGVSEAALAGRVATEARYLFSSGDGLGIHQSRSADSRPADKRVERQGRARDRAMCPAVTRSSLVAVPGLYGFFKRCTSAFSQEQFFSHVIFNRVMAAFERLSNLQIVILRTLLKRGADARPITLARWMRRSTIHLWRRGLIEIWYRQSVDHGSRGPFYTLTIFGARLAHEFLYPAPRGSSGAEKRK